VLGWRRRLRRSARHQGGPKERRARGQGLHAPPPALLRLDAVAMAGLDRRELLRDSDWMKGVDASTASRSWNGRVKTGSERTAMTQKLIAAASSWSTGRVSSSNTARPSCLNQAISC